MKYSTSTTGRGRRNVVRALAIGVALSLSTPLLTSSTPISAQSAPTSVTGLAVGSRGDAVRTVQQALVNQGMSVEGGVDGIYGPGTEAAVKAFQKSNGISTSGKVDNATAIALGLVQSDALGLTQGARSDAVKKMQQQLIGSGISLYGGADGVFGAATTAGLEQFQKAKGLSVTGKVDAATAGALASVKTGVTTAATTGADAERGAAAEQPTASTTGLVGLKIGSTGKGVKTVQRLIMDAGIDLVGGSDGIFGVLTANAVIKFQEVNGLTPDGIVGEVTLSKLQGATASPDHSPAATSPFIGLKYGSLGNSVKQLQAALMNAGITVVGGADGVFGLQTRASLRNFQQAAGLSRSDVVDEATANALSSGGKATGNSATSPMLGLKAGSLGNSVKQLQQAIMDAGVSLRGGADGIFGPATSQALKTFQTTQGIEATGVANDATVAALANPQQVGSDGGGTVQAGGYAAYGEKGNRVMTLQAALVNAGIALKGGVDGDFGSGTSAAVMAFQQSNGLKVTGKVDDATATALGIDKESAAPTVDPSTVKIDAFPVQGKCYFGDSYGYPRSGGRTHLGVDIIAEQGKLLYAVVTGKITKVYEDYPGSLSGNGVRIGQPDGTYFFYAHMDTIADGLGLGSPVKAGQVIGTVGNTGNSGTNHLHLEIHPKGGSAINPYPVVKAIDACNDTTPRG